jgi:MOSC domain-containing protein YiiM
MKVISVNVGKPKQVRHEDRVVRTGIFKGAVTGKIRVNEVNLEGDGQADLRVHGGHNKAIYVYPAEHYEFWREELPEAELPWGVFGENLTIEGILETDVRSGDRLKIGTAVFIVTAPRYPCFKLGIRFGRNDIIRRFAKSGRSGFYLAVEKTGELEAGDSIELSDGGKRGKTIAEIFSDRVG